MDPVRLLHFADSHIDMVAQGRLDPETGLSIRVMDFLAALDQIVDRAIEERVDLVLFAGDAYKDRNPQPTYQREWGRRLMRLSRAGIPTVLLVGNHDVARASNRAHTMHEYRTLEVPQIHVGDRIEMLTPERLGVPLQIITIPWVSPSALMTRQQTAGLAIGEVYAEIEERLTEAIDRLIESADPGIPLVLTAHASVEGARYGSERQVMLGHELVLSHGLMRRRRLDYVALGHIHKHQELNGGLHPPAVYPGSIERIDFGEIREVKGYVLAEVAVGDSRWRFEPLNTRRFLDFAPDAPSADTFMEDVLRQLPEPEEVAGAVCRVQLTYPREWEPQVDEPVIARRFEQALSFQLVKHRTVEKRARLGDTVAVEKMTPLELLETYWQTIDLDADEAERLQALAKEVLGEE